MTMNTSEKHRHDVLRFFCCTLGFSWLLWIPLAIAQVPVRTQPWLLLMELGGVAPSLIGIIFILRTSAYNGQTVKASFFSFRQIGIRNAGLSITLIVLAFSLGLLFDFLLFGNIPNIKGLSLWVRTPSAFLITMFSFLYSGPLTEEIGWRGFAAKMMMNRYGYLLTGVLLGAIWSIWHYPLFFLNGQYHIANYYVHIPTHLVYHMALTLLMVYFLIETNGSVLLAIILHMISNIMANAVFPRTFHSFFLQTLVLCSISLGLILTRRNRALPKPIHIVA